MSSLWTTIVGPLLLLVGIAYLVVPRKAARLSARFSLVGRGGPPDDPPTLPLRAVGVLLALVGLWVIVGADGPIATG